MPYRWAGSILNAPVMPLNFESLPFNDFLRTSEIMLLEAADTLGPRINSDECPVTGIDLEPCVEIDSVFN